MVVVEGCGSQLPHSILIFPRPAGRAIAGRRSGESRSGEAIFGKEG